MKQDLPLNQFKLLLRGGGVCTSREQQRQHSQNEMILNPNNSELIKNNLIIQLNNMIQEIKEIISIANTEKGRDALLKFIKWFQESDQFFQFFIDDKIQFKQYKKVLEDAFLTCMKVIPTLIQGERLLSIHYLKICNHLTRIIFSYYTSPDVIDKPENISDWQTTLAEINDTIESEGEHQLLYNGLCYEASLIDLCLIALPTKEAQNQEKELLKNSLIGIITSASSFTLSEELKNALKDGALILYQKFKKYQSKEKFKLCLYIEQLKWRIIGDIEKGVSLNLIQSNFKKIYIEIISKISDWNVLYSWIKIISEIMIFKPKISQEKYNSLPQKSNEKIDWDQAIQLRYIKPLTFQKNMAEIVLIENPKNDIDLQLNLIGSKFRILQNFLIQGDQELPPFINYYTLKNDKKLQNETNQQQIEIFGQELIQQLNEIPFQEIYNYLDNLIIIFSNYAENYYSMHQEQAFSSNQVEESQFQVNNLKFLQNLNQQIFEQFKGFSSFQYYQEILIDFINQLSSIKEDKILTRLREYNILNFFYQFHQISLQLNQIEFKEENLIQQIISQVDKNFQEQIALIQKDKNKIIDQISSFDFEKRKKQYSFQEIVTKAESFFLKIYSPFQILFKALPEKLQQDQIFIMKIIRNKSTKFQQSNEISQLDLKVIENYTTYLLLISVLKMLKCTISELQDILQENFVFENLNEAQKSKSIQFKMIYPQYLNLFQIYFEGDVIQKTNSIQIYSKVLEEVVDRVNSNSLQIEFTEMEQLVQLIHHQIQKSIDSVSLYYQNLMSIKDIVCKKQKKQEQKFLLNFNQLETQINIFLETFTTSEASERINFQDRMRDLQSSAQTIQIQLIQLQGDQVKQISNEIGQLILLLNYTLTKSSDDLNENEPIINENLQTFADSIKDIWNQKRELIESFFFNFGYVEKKNISVDSSSLKLVAEENFKLISELQTSAQQFNLQELQTKIELLSHLKLREKIYLQIKEIMKKNLNKISKIIQLLKDMMNYQKLNTEMTDNENKQIIGNFQNFRAQLEIIIEDRASQQLNSKIINFISQNLPFLNNKQIYNRQKQNDQQKQGWLQKITDIISNNFWRVKEGFIFESILIQNQLSEQNKQIIAKNFILISTRETDQRILKTLKNKEVIQQMMQSYNKYWKDMESIIQQDLQTQLRNLELIQNELQICENEEQRQKLIGAHNQLEQQIDEQLNNVSFIGDALGVTIKFLKDIKKDLAAIQSKLEKISSQLSEFGLDLKFLRGKTPQQLFEIRMLKVLQQKQLNDGKNVYVKLRTKELIPNSKFEDVEETTLFNDKTQSFGEIDEFLTQQKDSLLIHGPAGSGKSAAALKIEEFFWEQYQIQQKQINSQNQKTKKSFIPIIPIFIQLSSLKNPLSEAIEETLQSSSYNFDSKQILEFKDQVAQGKSKIIFILDSYDELSQNYIQQNLNISNKFKNWKFDTTNISNINQESSELSTIGYYPKIITTTRTESLQQSNYKEWFLSDSNYDYSKYKEVRILAFNKYQQVQYLQQFSYLQVKLAIQEFLETIGVKQTQGLTINQIFEQIWIEVQETIFKKDNLSEKVLNDQQIKALLQLLKANQYLDIRKELEEYFSKQLSQLWSPKTFENYIKEFNLQQLLLTPFMMKIIVEVLPQLTQDLSSINTQRTIFMKNYCETVYTTYIKPTKSAEELDIFLEKLKQIKTGYDQSQKKKTILEQNEDKSKSYELRNDSHIRQQNQRALIVQPNIQPNINQQRQPNQLNQKNNNDQKTIIILQPNLANQQQFNYQRQISQQQVVQNQQPSQIHPQSQQVQPIFYQNEQQDSHIFLQPKQYSNSHLQDQNQQFEIEFAQSDKFVKKSQQEINMYLFNKKLQEEVKYEIQICSQNRWQILSNTNFFIDKIRFLIDQNEPMIINQSLKQFYFTSFDFYETFYTNYINKSLKKMSNIINQKSLINFQSQILHYSIVLARLLMKKQLIGIDYEQKGMINLKLNKIEQSNEFYELFDETAPNATIFQQFRKCIPLKQKGNFVSFEHKSIQEYLFAKCIYDSLNCILICYQTIKKNQEEILNFIEISSTKQLINIYFKKIFTIIKWKQCKSEEEINNFLKDKIQSKEAQQQLEKLINEIHKMMHQINISTLNQFTLQSEFYLGAIKLLSEKIKHNYKLRRILRFLITLSKDFPEYINISSNSFQLLVFMQEIFKGEDFSKLRLSDIQLIGMKCIGCDFQDSNFQNVKMVGTNLNYCDLSKVKWENIQTQDLPILYLSSTVIKVQYSAGGEFIAALSDDNQLTLFLTSSGANIIETKGNDKELLRDFSWSPTIQSLAVCFNTCIQLRFVNLDKCETYATTNLDTTVFSVKFSKKSSFLAAGCMNYIYILNPNQQNLDVIYKSSEQSNLIYSSLDFSPDERQLVASQGKQFIILRNDQVTWNSIKTDEQNSNSTIINVCYSANGTQFATSNLDSKIQIWNKFGFLQREIKCDKPAWAIQYSPNGNNLVSGGEDKTISLWNPNTGALLGNFKGHSDCIFSLSFSYPYGNIILSSSKDCSIRQWHSQINSQLNDYLHGHEEEILFLIVTKNQKRIISKGRDKKIIQWNFQTGETLSPCIILNGCKNCNNSMLCEDCSRSPILSIENDQQIVTGGNGEQILIFDAFNGKMISASNNNIMPGEIKLMIYHTNEQSVKYLIQGEERLSIIVSLTKTGMLQSFNLITSEIIQKFYSSEISYLHINPYFVNNEFQDQNMQQKLFTIDTNGNLQMIDIQSLEIFGSVKLVIREKVQEQAKQCAAEYSHNRVIIVNPQYDYLEYSNLDKDDFGDDFGKKQLQIRGIEYVPNKDEIKRGLQISVTCIYVCESLQKIYLAFSDNKIGMFETYSFSYQSEITHPCQVTAMCSINNNVESEPLLIACGIDLTFRVYDVYLRLRGEHLLCHQDRIQGLIGSYESEFCVSWSLDKSIKIWQVGQGINLENEIKELKKQINEAKTELNLAETQKHQYNKIFSYLNQFEQNSQQFQSQFNSQLQIRTNLEQDQKIFSEQIKSVEEFQQDLLDLGRMKICGKHTEREEAMNNIYQQKMKLHVMVEQLKNSKFQQQATRMQFLEHLFKELNGFGNYLQRLISEIKDEMQIETLEIKNKVYDNQNKLKEKRDVRLYQQVPNKRKLQQDQVFQIKFQEYLSLSKFPQDTKFAGTKFSQAKITTSVFQDLTQIWMLKQKKFENYSH